MNRKRQRYLAIFQGLFYIGSGIWPLIDMASFLEVTGPKDDVWLVKTVGVLIVVAGLALLTAGIRGRIDMQTYILAIGYAIGLAVVEINYVVDGVISSIYLVDSAIEIILAGLWISSFMKPKETRTAKPAEPREQSGPSAGEQQSGV